MIAYKFLRPQAFALLSRTYWPLPRDGAPGAYVQATSEPLEACRSGVHACRVEDLAFWLSEELWEVELDGDCQVGPQSVIARRGRLLRRIETWNAETGARFAQACAVRAEQALALGRGDVQAAGLYVTEARNAADGGNYAVASYAAAISSAALVGAAEGEAAFHAERQAQSAMLRALLGSELQAEADAAQVPG